MDNSYKYTFSKEINDYLEFTGCGKLISVCHNDDGADVLTVDIGPLEIPQFPVNDVHKNERIVIEVNKDALPLVFVRENFPIVPHLNVLNNGRCTLCLYDVSYRDIQYSLTAARFVKRIYYWFNKTARGELHRPNQPLEPFFEYSDRIIILNETPHNVPFIRLKELDNNPKILSEIPLEEQKGEIYCLALAKVKKLKADNIISKIPQNVEELNFSFGSDIIAEIYKAIPDIWSVKQNGKLYKDYFNQSENTLKNSKVILLVCIELYRQDDGEVEHRELKAFVINQKFGSLYKALNYQIVKSNMVKTPGSKGCALSSIQLTAYEVYAHQNRRLAQIYNGEKFEQHNANFVQIGLGALGAQIADNFIRSGYGKWSYIDSDILLPHNLARHCLLSEDIGKNKAAAMVEHYNKIMLGEENIFTAITADTFSKTQEENIARCVRKSKMVVDSSASVAVERFLCHELAQNTRCLSTFLNPSGTAAIMLIENETRSVKLDELEMQYYKTLINNEKYYSHLESPQSVIYSVSCRSSSMTFSQDNTSAFSGLCCKAIKAVENNPKGQIIIWTENEMSINAECIPAESYCVYECNDWIVKVSSTLQKNLFSSRYEKLPYETGGVLIGAFDSKYKTCYVVDSIPSPDDSVEYPDAYIRGSKGLLDNIQKIEEITVGNLGYIGEWHSHPTDVTDRSTDDMKLLTSISRHNAYEGIPGVMIIVGESHISVYIEAAC